MNYVSDALNHIREMLLEKIDRENIVSIIVFGSAARPNDFVPKISDIDVLILIKKPQDMRSLSFKVYDSEVHASLLTLDQFIRIIKIGSPLALMLRYRVLLYGEDIENMLGDVKVLL